MARTIGILGARGISACDRMPALGALMVAFVVAHYPFGLTMAQDQTPPGPWAGACSYQPDQPCTRPQNGTAAKHRFQVRDSVEMSYFGTIASSQRDHLPDDGIVSPDGRYVVKVTHRGVLPEGVTEGTIWLFETSAIIDGIESPRTSIPPPIPLVRISAAANGITGDFLTRDNTISELAWSDDGKSLTFLGRDRQENRRLFRLEVATRSLRALTPESQDVVIYSASGNAFAYLAADNIDPEALWQSAGSRAPDIEVGTGKPLIEMLYPNMRANDTGKPLVAHVWCIRDGRAEPVIEASSQAPVRVRTSYRALAASLSPSGSHLSTIAYEGEADTALHYTIIDLDTGEARTIADATATPVRYRRVGRLGAAWSPDESEILISEVQLAGAANAARCSLAVTNFRSGRTSCILPADPRSTALLRSFRWISSSRIYLNHKSFRVEEYRDQVIQRTNGRWGAPRPASRDSLPAIRLTVRESLNERPVLMATDLRSGKQRMVFDPNPQLDEILLGSVEVFEWRDRHGRAHRGGLVKPPGFQRGRRYPLVVQTHGFQPDEFYRIGDSDTSSAGRALASRDILVLQVKEPAPTGDPSWRDGTELGLDVYLAGIDRLAAEGLIDPKKVGISGYSYTGWTTTMSIVRAPHRFAAAVIANTDPVTMTGYFAGVDSHNKRAYESEYVGVQPFGDGLQAWIERVPSLASEEIDAAVLFAAADPWHLIVVWDLYAAMRLQNKPVELQYIRNGQHVISKPLHKLAHQELIVDWFEFWLADREQPDPVKAEQYARWRQLRPREEE